MDLIGYKPTAGNGNGAGAIVDFSRYGREVSELVKITAESFKKAAVIGLINHRWKVTKITDDEVTGVLKEEYEAKIVRVKRGGQTTNVRISISGPRVQQKWADIIRREMAVALVLLSQ